YSLSLCSVAPLNVIAGFLSGHASTGLRYSSLFFTQHASVSSRTANAWFADCHSSQRRTLFRCLPPVRYKSIHGSFVATLPGAKFAATVQDSTKNRLAGTVTPGSSSRDSILPCENSSKEVQGNWV